ncbi:hypothetical protein ACFLZZ_01360 [Nanoarchaeota archaeon]
MIIAVRIAGQIRVRRTQKSTLESLMLKRKYTAIVVSENELPRLKSVKDLITFGEIDDESLKELVIKRGKKGKKSISNADEIVKGLKSGKRLRELGINPFFTLHPPRGGFKQSTKLPYPNGVLGNNKDILKLVKKML